MVIIVRASIKLRFIRLGLRRAREGDGSGQQFGLHLHGCFLPFNGLFRVFGYGDRHAILRVDPTARYSHPAAESMGIVCDAFANVR
jgi:hypothetical protein